MTAASWGALAMAGVLAVADWVAVARGARRSEYVLKPAVMVALVAVAVTIDPEIGGRRWWFVAALVASLAGDVFLMLRHDREEAGERHLFVAGLASFLVAHLLYTAGFLVDAPPAGRLALASAVVAVAAAVVGTRIVRAASASLQAPVTAYVVVISAMVATALAAGDSLAAVGAVTFYASDFLIGWTRFVAPLPGAPVAIMVTYHAGQAALVASLAG